MDLKDKKILVTGGAGFIGSHICEKLVSLGSSVTILDDLSTGKEKNIASIKDKIKFIKGSVEDYRTVLNSTKKIDYVIHQAFPYGRSGMGLDEQYTEAGVIGTFNVLKASVINGVKKVVNASSVAAYGIPKYTPLDEKHPTNPFLPYGATKIVGELYCKTFSNLYTIDTISLRYFYVYGARYAQFDHSAMVNFLIRSVRGEDLIIYGNGSQIRDYTYIDDIVNGTLLALLKENSLGTVYNISGGDGITILDLAKKIKKLVNKKSSIKFAGNAEYRFSDKYNKIPIGLTTKVGGKWIDERNYIGNISLAKKELGYKPKIKIDDGIQRTANWLKSIM
ncbi:MAG: NAD-dependent epimerase/dehydratase family protein [Candidatus Aenigmarchaeota archaeon]|nr:NAD-dependent epimerase/dehydratase family protein [Candidatus Aenigmarchaeota archaeon]